MNPVDTLFQRLRNQGRKAFMPFLAAGDPNLAGTTQLLRELARHVSGPIEIGFPYSDPLADGPVIQASYTRALSAGVTLSDIFAMLQKVSAEKPFADGSVPLVGMAAYSLVHRRGPEVFVEQAQKAGLSGLIVPDLPVEEAEGLARFATARDFKLIQLVTPTSPRERAVQIAKISTGFIYYVSVTGITGERERLPDELLEQLAWLRTQTSLPICVGFGISKPEHVRMLREVVDGVIVGSAFVRQLEGANARPLNEVAQAMTTLAQSLTAALDEKTGKS